MCLHSYIRTGEDATAYSPSYCVRSSGLVLLLRILCFVVPVVSHLSVLTQSSPSFPSFFVYVSFGGSSVNISSYRPLHRRARISVVPSFLPSPHIHTSLCFSFHSLSCTCFPGFVFFPPNEMETSLSAIVCTIYYLPPTYLHISILLVLHIHHPVAYHTVLSTERCHSSSCRATGCGCKDETRNRHVTLSTGLPRMQLLGDSFRFDVDQSSNTGIRDLRARAGRDCPRVF